MIIIFNNFPNLCLFIFVIFIFAKNINCEQFKENTTNNVTNPEQNTIDEDDTPVETQSAQCTITAGEVQASAQATISKKLEGVCGSKQMKQSFEILEARLMNEIYQIKLLLMNSNWQSAQQPSRPINEFNNFYSADSSKSNYPISHYSVQPQQYFSQPIPVNLSPTINIPSNNQYHSDSFAHSTTKPLDTTGPTVLETSIVTSTIPTTTATTPQTIAAEKLPQDVTTAKPTVVVSSDTIITSTTEKSIEFRPVQLKSLKNRFIKPKISKVNPRDFEVQKFNNTILAGAEIRIFTYYWRMDNFTMKLKSNVSHILSPIFSISGLHLRVKATLNYLNRDYLYLQLESIPNDKIEDTSNVILETGDLFKEIETKKLFRHKIVILDQGTPTSDLISQEFLNTNSGFPVPNSAITAGPYSKDDSILLKIVIFL